MTSIAADSNSQKSDFTFKPYLILYFTLCLCKKMSLFHLQNRCTAFNYHQKESAFLPKLKHYYVIFLHVYPLISDFLYCYHIVTKTYMQRVQKGIDTMKMML